MESCETAVPLTDFQRELLALLGRNRAWDGYLAGGTALHFSPTSFRFSQDIDFFHDSVEAVAKAFANDSGALERAGYSLELRLSQPGFIRALVAIGDQAILIDWAHDSAWRFMPVVRDIAGCYLLHEVDLAINKVLALAGREEARDFLDVVYAHERILPLGATVWAAVGKDRGYTPVSLLEQLKRRGRYRQEDIDRLALAFPFDLAEGKLAWRGALADAGAFLRSRPSEEAGCLYYSPCRDRFTAPSPGVSLEEQGLVTHYGQLGGILPRAAEDA